METYEKLWNDATAAFKRGTAQIDPHLPGKKSDRRRGVTLILRPSPAVCNKANDYLNRLAEVMRYLEVKVSF